jgi:hypothetical protein
MTSRRWLSIFASILAAALILLAIGLTCAMKIVSDPGYPASTFDPAVALQDNAFRWHNRACDVLIYGDSTADVGLDPRVITAQTGLSACNIATNRPIVDTLGTMPVDAFLAHNPKPQLLVLQFGPELFYRSRTPWQNAGPYSPMVVLTRDVPRITALRIMLAQPSETTAFLLYILQTRLLPRHAATPALAENFQQKLAYAEASNGQLDLGFPALTACDSPALKLYGPVDAAWIRELHRRYEAEGIAVVVRASPVPTCDPQRDKFRADLASLVDDDSDPLPVNLYVGGGRHMTHEGSQAATLALVHFLERRKPIPLPIPAPTQP